MPGIPILTYHALRIESSAYHLNDHVALREDLRLLTRLGWRVIPALEVAQLLIEPKAAWPEKCVAITLDDGTNFDYEDLLHPQFGQHRGMLNILRDFAEDFPGAQPTLHATSFVIASKQARDTMDRCCIVGRGWMSDSWWQPALASGLMHIASHSWDHCHDSLEVVAQREQRKGSFVDVDTQADADAQIKAAAATIAALAPNPGVALFAYPYGHANGYLLDEYLPAQAGRADAFVYAAFSTEPGPVTRDSGRWWIPRYVCGHHWKSPEQLQDILLEAS